MSPQTILVNLDDWSAEPVNVLNRSGHLAILGSVGCGKTTILRSLIAEAVNQNIPVVGLADMPELSLKLADGCSELRQLAFNPLQKLNLEAFDDHEQESRLDCYRDALVKWLTQLACEGIDEADAFRVHYTEAVLEVALRSFYADPHIQKRYEQGDTPTLADFVPFCTLEHISALEPELAVEAFKSVIATLQAQLKSLLESEWGHRLCTRAAEQGNGSMLAIYMEHCRKYTAIEIHTALLALLHRLLEVPTQALFFMDGDWWLRFPGVSPVVEALCSTGRLYGIHAILTGGSRLLNASHRIRDNISTWLIGECPHDLAKQVEDVLGLPAHHVPNYDRYFFGNYSIWQLVSRNNRSQRLKAFFPGDLSVQMPVATLPLKLAAVPHPAPQKGKRSLPFMPPQPSAVFHAWELVPSSEDATGNLEEALQALNLASDADGAALQRGTILMGLGHYEQALEHLDRAWCHSIGSTNEAIVHLTRGLANQALGRHHAAICDYGKAMTSGRSETIALQPGDSKALTNRGCAYAALGQYVSAGADFNRALALDPQSHIHYLNRGLCQLKLQKRLEAITDLEKAIQLIQEDESFGCNRHGTPDIPKPHLDLLRQPIQAFPDLRTPSYPRLRLPVPASAKLLERIFTAVVQLMQTLKDREGAIADLERQWDALRQDVSAHRVAARQLAQIPDQEQEAKEAVGRVLDLEVELDNQQQALAAAHEALWEEQDHLEHLAFELRQQKAWFVSGPQEQVKAKSKDSGPKLAPGWLKAFQAAFRSQASASPRPRTREEEIQHRLVAIRERA
jgi:tetratricopeptide (TPR) repeat protein